jgi:hypothetical protein
MAVSWGFLKCATNDPKAWIELNVEESYPFRASPGQLCPNRSLAHHCHGRQGGAQPCLDVRVHVGSVPAGYCS